MEAAIGTRSCTRRVGIRLALLTVSALLFATGGELVARLSLAISGSQAAQERHSFRSHLPGVTTGSNAVNAGEPAATHTNSGAQGEPRDVNPAVQRAYGGSYVLHPFFGYTFAPGAAGANNEGFFSNGVDFPFRRSAGELVVGIFGGSVAMQIAAASGQLSQSLLPLARHYGFEAVRIVSFAVGGWRQPQTFNALASYLDLVDLAIEIDGFNEVIHLGSDRLRDYPAEFPWSEVFVPLATSRTTPEQARALQQLDRLNHMAAYVTRVASVRPLSSSRLAHLAWRAFRTWYENRSQPERTAILAEQHREWLAARTPRGIAVADDEIAVRRERYLAHFADLLRFSQQLARVKRSGFIHFIQPNQYQRGAKPLSQEEQHTYVTHTAWFPAITSLYERLEGMSTRLRKQGVDSHFLGWIFQATSETVYSDSCCHLNQLGIEIVIRGIAQIVSESRPIHASLALARARSHELANVNAPGYGVENNRDSSDAHLPSLSIDRTGNGA